MQINYKYLPTNNSNISSKTMQKSREKPKEEHNSSEKRQQIFDKLRLR